METHETIEDAAKSVIEKLEVLQELELEPLRAAVRCLQASFLDTGHFVALRIAHNLNKELRKLECLK
jgi:hypothetical protein